jgi:hypothetical protein
MPLPIANRALIALGLAATVAWILPAHGAMGANLPQQSGAQQAQQQQPPPTQKDDAQIGTADSAASKSAAANFQPRGKKLVMKDGTYQIVRSYEKRGDTVRYYSVEQSQWEEIPTSLVDWDATAKAESAEASRAQELAARAAKRDAQMNAGEVLDVDASLEVAPGVILPQDEGLFVVQGNRVAAIGQSQTTLKTDKKQAAKKILSPIPIIPERHNLEISGKSAAVRLDGSGPDPEFYLRVPYDSAEEPHIQIVCAQIKGDNRIVDVIETNVAGESSNVHTEVSIQRWIVARGVYRYTLGAPLTPGEYAVEETVPSGVMMFVWDFGVDKPAPGTTISKPH